MVGDLVRVLWIAVCFAFGWLSFSSHQLFGSINVFFNGWFSSASVPSFSPFQKNGNPQVH
ncbi:hypothetical protein TSUD_131140 [Trifolium subterraneum]|uniref:Uncharacterized protein n=1 Tax=Trifolium subterraneum TaxID=3900 RepID=A0A2Z6NFP6_TRISU|nr:hypothetical protein TSUD_131140 [Trifolium subterraneum]